MFCSMLGLQTVEDFVPFVGGAVGVSLLSWICLQQSREIQRLRDGHHELSRELGKKCKNCELAKTANEMLARSGRSRMEEEDDK